MRTVLEWVLRALGRHPATWIGACLLFLGTPLLVRLSPLDSRSVEALVTELVATWALPAGLLGTVAGLRVLAGGREFLLRMPAALRLASELTTLWFLANLALVLLLAGALMQAGPSAAALELWPGWLLQNLQLALWAGLCLRLGLEPALTLLAYLIAVLLVPWGLGGSALDRASVWFDASIHVRLWKTAPLWALTWGLLPLLALLQGNRLLNRKTP